jgi:hypothetical protein
MSEVPEEGMIEQAEYYDLNKRIEKLSQFLEIKKNKIENYESLEPICADRKISYYLNADEQVSNTKTTTDTRLGQDKSKVQPLFPLIHYIIETHRTESLSGSQFLLCS